LSGFGFDESTRRLIICETLTHQKRGRPLLNPLNYGTKPLFHWRLFWGRSHARKLLQFCKKRCSFQKAQAGAVLYVCHQRIKPPRSPSMTDAAVVRTSMREKFAMKIIAFEEHFKLPTIHQANGTGTV
jgi:hypothetical protein